jgi:hypothetical protein
MSTREKTVLWTAVALTFAVTAYGVARMRSIRSVTGAVLRQDSSPEKQLTIPNAEITIGDNPVEGTTKSDAAGYFRVKLRTPIRKGRRLTLHVRHAEYRPLDVTARAADQLYVLRMTPAAAAPVPTGPPVAISDVRLRYAVTSQRTVNVGSVVKMFQVVNEGNVRCPSNGLCSPDRKWQASVGGASLDAGQGNEFQNARVSCIAGPCPFTKIQEDSFSHGGREIKVSVLDWSDPTTFVLEAEVMHTMSSGVILHSYPLIFNQTANFTLPPKAQGPSLEATVDHHDIVFPLGPLAKLSWADCEVQTAKDLTKLYRCVLKPGYRFQ